MKATNIYEVLKKCSACFSHIRVVWLWLSLVLSHFCILGLCLVSWRFFFSQIFLSGISQTRNILKKQGTSFQFCLGFEESLMVAQSSTITRLLGSPASQKLKESKRGDLHEARWPMHACEVALLMSDSLWPYGLYVAHQASLSMGFSRQEYWSGLPFPAAGLSSQPRDRSYISYLSCIGQVGSLPLAPPGKPYKLGKIHSCLTLQQFYKTGIIIPTLLTKQKNLRRAKPFL